MNNQNPYVKSGNTGSVEELKAMQGSPYNYPNPNESPYTNGQLNKEISGAIYPSLSKQQHQLYNQPYPSYQPGNQNAVGSNQNPPIVNQQYAPPPPAYSNNYPPNYGQNGKATHIIIQKNIGNYDNPCQYCHKNCPVITRKKMGCATWGWGLALFWFTGCCCWIPCVIDDCYDLEIICQSCMGVRNRIKSQYCC